MFYDPIEDKVYDFVEGKADLDHRLIRAIGNAHERISEDRLRMIRAIRMSERFGFAIEQQTIDAIIAHADELIPAVAIERIMQEFAKMSIFLKTCLISLHEYGLLQNIFPTIKDISKDQLTHRLTALDKYPQEAPLISKLLLLFGEIDAEQVEKLCYYLKLSKEDREFALFLTNTKYSIAEIRSDYELACLYSNPNWDITLLILKAHVDDRTFEHHVEKRDKLSFWVDKMIHKNPIVTSAHLKEIGIEPGVKMGKLLKEAEMLAVDKKLDDAQDIIKLLEIN